MEQKTRIYTRNKARIYPFGEKLGKLTLFAN
jgi:hypothetical protein